MANIDFLHKIISTLDSIQSLERVKSGKAKVDITDLTKRVYDFTKEQSCRNTSALPELVTEGFDEEQIWQQLELQNEDEMTHFSTEISKVLASDKKLMIPVSSVASNESEDDQRRNISALPELVTEGFDKEQIWQQMELQNEDEMTHFSTKNSKVLANNKKLMIPVRSSIVDDKFFKLQELDEYLIKEEKKEKQNENDTESDNESVDFFNDLSEEDDEDNAEGKYVKYADFFDSPESENDQLDKNKNLDHDESVNDSEEDSENEDEEMDDDEEEQEKVKRVRFNLTNDSDETDSLENKVNYRKEDKKEEEIKNDKELKSTLEARQERLLSRIQELEEEAIGEKPWQLKGEVSGPNRPQNSLLEEFVEVDINTRPAPAITEETTVKLEDIIKQRIKDKAWDDVEKKFKPVETPLEYKKKLILDQAKSKESLSQIYEKEYLKQKQALDPENNEKKEEFSQLHNEIRQMMRSLMSKLDALSNYHYTPKMAKPEIKIISNVPAIRMEEVAPVTTSDATLLAPEEIKTKPRGDVIGKSERTKTDMKRERRRKKMKQRAKQQAIEKKEKLKTLKPGISKKYEDRKEKAAMLKKVIKDRNVTKLDETTQKVAKSSTAFFTQLQNQTKSKFKRKDSLSKKKNDIDSAVKLKL